MITPASVAARIGCANVHNMPAFALVLYAVWFLLAFGLRTVVQLRRTGESGFKGIGGRPGSLEWWAGVLFVVALVVGVVGPVAALAGLDPLVDAGGVEVAGAVVAVVGIVLTLLAQLSMGDSWRIGVDETETTELVTARAFEIVRNPIFSAMLVTAVGLALMVPNVVSVVGLVALVIALELQVRGVEEPYLATVHGDAYADYCHRVGRFVPGIGRN
jgi:protein-S-isoprenylcysteine O-methyltransferase Ste14